LLLTFRQRENAGALECGIALQLKQPDRDDSGRPDASGFWPAPPITVKVTPPAAAGRNSAPPESPAGRAIAGG
jgi:hypothetical protein